MVKRSKVKSPDQLLMRPKVYDIYRTGKSTNFKTGTPMKHTLLTATANYKGL